MSENPAEYKRIIVIRKDLEMKKTLVSIVAVSALILSLTACGTEAGTATSTENISVTETTTEQAGVQGEDVSGEQLTSGNITALKLSSDEAVTLFPGQCDITSYLIPEITDTAIFKPGDVTFISTNPEVAEINFTKAARNNNLYFSIDAIAPGEAEVYAVTADGTVESVHKKVIVSER